MALNFILNHLKSTLEPWDYLKHAFARRENSIFKIRVKVFIVLFLDYYMTFSYWVAEDRKTIYLP